MTTMNPAAFAEALGTALVDWLPDRRWFAGGGRTARDVEVVSLAQVEGNGVLAVVAVRFADGVEHYHLPLALRRDAPDVEVIARVGEVGITDGAGDPDLPCALFDAMARNLRVSGASFRSEPRSGLVAGRVRSSRALGVEQSNTSVVLGERYVLKLFRRLAPGLNPDLEVHRALGLLGSEHVVPVLGAIEGELDGTRTTLGVLHPFLAHAEEGWDLATRSAAPFAARELGEAVAAVHRQLVVAFGAATLDAGELSRELLTRLDAAAPLLHGRGAWAREVFTAVAGLPPVPAQRVHGDLHLGQVLRADGRWLLIDFEGEPSAPVARRRAVHSPLRDVAGVLRSFDYTGSPLAPAWAAEFLRGYADESGIDLDRHRALLTAYELDKAVYEVVYETRNRPDRVHVPLRALRRPDAA
ncbi:phosphotransferase [Saccharothrix sp. BKS2]|uniref:maltokinase N-terminal cap-like domain-containing protein n=1 Tax=Saccharothrix sp. BKS2 TaxID=3064400 RepID=UPI0039E96A24